MNRRAAIALAILTPVSVIIVGVVLLITATRGMPDVAQTALARYLAFLYLSPGPSIGAVSQATQPWLFKPEQSSATYSESVHYHTTVNLRALATRQISRSPSPAASPDIYHGSDGLAGLPYPPEDLWCVLLDTGEQGTDVVLVALHMGLYNADWVVHELPANWSAAERSAALAELGCGVEMGR